MTCRSFRGLAAVAVLAAGGLAMATPPAHAENPGHPNVKPGFVEGAVLCTTYDGVGDDLLTGGLGKSGIESASPPGFVDPLNPTAAELRRRAIHTNYRAIVDPTPLGGFGVLYGPNIDPDGNPTLGEGKIAGTECLAFAGDASGRENVTMMVQIPMGFDPASSCIVAGPSSGSRAVYGAIGTAGEWGLKRGCAVAYTDKGSGNGAHDLQNDTVNLINGLRANATAAGRESNFTARIDPEKLAAFNAATPNRFAFKHAHSQLNPEKDWGQAVLRTVEFAFWQLNEMYGARDEKGTVTRQTITPANTIVIASGVSNGGGASVRAAEEDKHGLIDGVAVTEPVVQPEAVPEQEITRGGIPVAKSNLPLYDYFTIANLFQPCARMAPSVAASPLIGFVNAAIAINRCAALAARGLVNGATPEGQGESALQVLRASGWEAESDLLHASHYAFAVPAVSVTYANAYGGFSVVDNACGFSFGATDATGNPVPAPAANVARIFGTGNGVPPTDGINIINNLSLGGPKLDGVSVSENGVLDFNVGGALCLRSLATGTDPASGATLTALELARANQVFNGIEQVRPTGDLRGKPTIIAHGRSDALIPTNHTSRPYAALNRLVEGNDSRLTYIEVTNAQHFDAFIPFPGYSTRFVPLHYYFIQAMNLMYEHLKTGANLPPSQVVRTTPRATAADPISVDNVPPIRQAPDPADLIEVTEDGIDVPN